MKVIFLDIDGVLVTMESFTRYRRSGSNAQAHPDCVEQLNRILAHTGAAIVLSSTWRMFGRPYMDRKFTEWKIQKPVTDFTPILQTKEGEIVVSQPRGHEIQSWLDGHPEVRQFVILDDESDMAHLLPALVKTDFNDGLTVDLADLVIKRLI